MTVFIVNRSAFPVHYAIDNGELYRLAPEERAITELPEAARLELTLRPDEGSKVINNAERIPKQGLLNKLKRMVSTREYQLSVTKRFSVPNLKHLDEIEIHTDKRELESSCAYLFCEATCNGYRIPATHAEVNDREAITEEFLRLEKRGCFRAFWLFIIGAFIFEGGFGLLALALVILLFDPAFASWVLAVGLGIILLTVLGELTDLISDLRKLPIKKYVSLPFLLNELNKGI